MSHLDELDEFEAKLELELKREYTAVFGLFRYCILTQDATYLCNKLDMSRGDLAGTRRGRSDSTNRSPKTLRRKRNPLLRQDALDRRALHSRPRK